MQAVRFLDGVVLAGGFPALAGVDLAVEYGEVVLLQGANGAGKSTLLGACAGFNKLTSGTAEVLGCNLATQRAEVRRRVGLLGHTIALYRNLTAMENLQMWARVARIRAVDIEYSFDRLNITENLQKMPIAQLSKGQQQQVALAAIIARRPEIWLLDEPFSGLDANSRELLFDVISEAAQAGATILIASHDTAISSGCDARIVRMIAGVVVD